MAESLEDRVAAALEGVVVFDREDDGALTAHHDGTVASLRAVTITAGLDLLSLTQIIAWDLPADSRLRARVAQHTHDTLLGTVSLVSKNAAPAGVSKNSKKTADVLLRYNFPAAGLGDEALRTLILMVLAAGADIRRDLTGR
jgi:hypothetical protein